MALEEQTVVDTAGPGQPASDVVTTEQPAPAAPVETAAPEAKPVSRREMIEKAAKDVAAKRTEAPKAAQAPSTAPVTNAAGRQVDPVTKRYVKADGSLGELAPVAEQPKSVRAFPKSWRPELEQDYHKLPAHILDQIEKREADIFKGIEEYKKQAMPADLRAVIGPREQAFVQQYGSVAGGLNQLFQLSDFAARDPAGFVQWFAQQRGINLGQQAQGDTQAQVDPNYSALQAELAGLKNELVGFKQQSQQAAIAPYINEIERFKSEAGHERFDELKPHMGALIQAGAAKNLQEAYDQAYRAQFPDEWLSAQKATWLKGEQDRATQAKQAAVQVTGAPSQAAPPSVDPKNRRAVIEQAFRNIGRN
jgi:hypothetical protein